MPAFFVARMQRGGIGAASAAAGAIMGIPCTPGTLPMNSPMPTADMQTRLQSARAFADKGQVLQAESLYVAILKDWPESVEAGTQLALFAMNRGDPSRAANLLERARLHAPDDRQIALNLAYAYAHSRRPAAARNLLEQTVRRFPDFHQAWLVLSQVRDVLGDVAGANKALFQAVKRAQDKGLWLSEATTPPQFLKIVLDAMTRLRNWRRDLFMGSFDALRRAHGPDALKRVERALSGYLREWDATPTDPRQRPKFMFFPDLPSTPYLDPKLLPFADVLTAAYPRIRAEAERLLADQVQLPGFLTFKDGDRIEDYVSGDGAKPAWDAFFFYRHGRRYDDNHARCPETSAVLESIELCRIRDQAPEICFSVLSPGSHIMPHHGVSNCRVVAHLPLIVPADCALNIVDGEAHHWREGELMVFDDTFRHEAWNRSQQTRVILLMDVWNPHLTDIEKQAIKLLVESISDFEGEAKLA
jgi:aspartate beta-hydroxylase